MSLYDAEGFAAFVASLPGTTANEQWDSLVAKVGGKAFALRSTDQGSVVFKVSELSFLGLSEIEGVQQAPYFAKGQWVMVARDALPDATLRDYIVASYRLIAAKLTRKLRAELGLTDA